MMRRRVSALIIALCASLAMPAAGQINSASFEFLKAIRERDGTTALRLANDPVAINSRDRANGEGALHYVVRDRDFIWLHALLKKGARPDLQNNRGDTPLALAAAIGWTEGARALIDRRASVDLPNSRGETPLILATHRRDVAMAKLLLAAGANPERKDNVADLSARDYARRDPRAGAILLLFGDGAERG